MAEHTGEDWEAAQVLAPRHMFVPAKASASRSRWIDREADPRGWWDAVGSDTAIVTQIDDGDTELTPETAARSVNYTSSCSAPSIVFDFLRLLDARAGDKVLEIGTGTGWTAALLSARLGGRNVVTVEIDAVLAARAAANLEKTGLDPQVVVSDGAAGWKAEAPYDGVHVTCGVAEVPYSWVEQSRAGATIVLPWMHGFGGGQTVRLAVEDDGTATGRFHGDTAYMLLRSQRPLPFRVPGARRESTTVFHPSDIARGGAGLAIALSGLLPGVQANIGERDDASVRIALRTDDSYALVSRAAEGALSEVEQAGPRNLWEEVEAAYARWAELGFPPSGRFGMTVDPHGQHIWLDHTGNRVERVSSL